MVPVKVPTASMTLPTFLKPVIVIDPVAGAPSVVAGAGTALLSYEVV
jgi:hypothetical protein